MAQMKGEGVLINYRSGFRFWRKHRGVWGGFAARFTAAAHALIWSLGRLFLTLLFLRPWRELASRLWLYGQILALAVGLKK